MSTVYLTFDPVSGQGNNKGSFEMFVDLAENDVINIMPPAGFSIQAINMYPLGDSGRSPVQPSPAKKDDMTSLRNPNTDWSSVFTASKAPANFGFELSSIQPDGSYSLTDQNTSAGESYEYLIWVQSGNDNDYIDPGLRNRGVG